MKSKYLKMDCYLKRWGKTVPITFLIDTTNPSYPTVVYDMETRKSLMGRKIKKPRPLKANAYSFAHLESTTGDIISEKITQTGNEAAEFAAKVLDLAVPISEEEYRMELGRVIWPSRVDHPEHLVTEEASKEGLRAPGKNDKDAGEKAAREQEGISEKAGKKGSEMGRAVDKNDIAPQAASLSYDMRRKLALELIDTAERMNNEALRLLKSARLLLE